MPVPALHFELYQGLTFAGYQLLALDAAGSAVAQDEGTTYLCQARTAAGKELAFALPVVRGTEATGQILMQEVSATLTADYPLGLFVFDLIRAQADKDRGF